MANILRGKIIIMSIIGFLLVSSSLIRAEATGENGTNDEHKVRGRRLLNNYIGYGGIGEGNKHRPHDQTLPPPANKYTRPCSKLNHCDHS